MIPEYILQAAKAGIEEAVMKSAPFISVAIYTPSNGIFPLTFNDFQGKVTHFVNVGAIGRRKKQEEVIIVLDTYQRVATEEERLNFLLTGKMERIGGPQSLANDDRSFHALNLIQVNLGTIPKVIYSANWTYHKRGRKVEWEPLQTNFHIAEDAAILDWIRYGYGQVVE